MANLGEHLGDRATSVAIPGAALLGTGALAAGAYIMREELAELMHTAVAGSSKMTRRLPNLLALTGIRRRRSFLAAAAPELAGFAVGLVSGAALTFWLAPKLGTTIESGPLIGERPDTASTNRSESESEPLVPMPHTSR